MPTTRRLAIASGLLAAMLVAPAVLRAQATPAAAPAAAPAPTADSLAFPRQFVKWIAEAQGDSAFAHAGTRLREAMQSAEAVSGMAGRIRSRFGETQGTDAEVQFDDGALKVYIAVVRLSQAPEPGAWVVAYDPSTKIVERSSFGALSNVKNRFPQAKLP